MSCGSYSENFWSYRQVACSPECFQELEKIRLGIVEESKVEETVETDIELKVEIVNKNSINPTGYPTHIHLGLIEFILK